MRNIRLSRRTVPVMPRMTVYLPAELHTQVKAAQLPVSEILQEALRRELSRRQKVQAMDEYLAELTEEVGEPTTEDIAEAERIMAEIRGHRDAKEAS